MSFDTRAARFQCGNWLEAPIVGHGLWARYEDAKYHIAPSLLAACDEVDRLRAALAGMVNESEQANGLHHQDPSDVTCCEGCGFAWPCGTERARVALGEQT